MDSVKTYRREEWVSGAEAERLLNTLGAIQNSGQTGVKKYGRNDYCPCGSGKKFKACHLNKGN